MKKLQNNFTTPEQSKRLLELGVPADSADCYYGSFGRLGWRNEQTLRDGFFAEYRSYTPCWSVGRLMEIFDMCCINEQSSNVGWCLYRKLYEGFHVRLLVIVPHPRHPIAVEPQAVKVPHAVLVSGQRIAVPHLAPRTIQAEVEQHHLAAEVVHITGIDKRLNSERQRQLDDIYMYGGFLDLGTDEERSEPVPPSEPPAQPATEPVQAASSPQAVEPLQLSLF